MKKQFLYLFSLAVMALVIFSCEPEEPEAMPVAAFEVDASSVLEVGEEITFINNSTDAVSYVWSFGDGNTAEGATATHTYTAAGMYTVTLEASADGNRDVASVDVTIEEAPDNRQLIYIDNTDFKMRSLTLADGTTSDLFDLTGFSFGVEYDPATGFIYYTDDDNKTLVRNTLAGNDETVLVSDLGEPQDIALDAANGIMYLADRGNSNILAIDLSDNSTTVVFDTLDDATFRWPVGIDYYSGALYMTAVEVDAEAVWSGSVDGTGLTRILDFNDAGFGYGIEVDEVNEMLYFDDNWNGAILSAGLDGSGLTTVGPTTERSYGLAIDNENSLLFYSEVSDQGTITQIGLDGSDREVLVENGNNIRGMVLINPEN